MKGAGGEEVYCRDEPVQFHKLPLGIRAVEKLLSRRKKSSVARAKTGYVSRSRARDFSCIARIY